jgi:hypothetical protein
MFRRRVCLSADPTGKEVLCLLMHDGDVTVADVEETTAMDDPYSRERIMRLVDSLNECRLMM